MEAFPEMVQDLLGEISAHLLNLLKDRNQSPLFPPMPMEDLIKPTQIQWFWHGLLLIKKN
jgi:hypothetical protein